MEVNEQASESPLLGLTSPQALLLERFPIRTREDGFTHAAWRLTATCAEGEGAIALVEISPDRSLYRGEGVFLGWPQDRLKAAYRALKPASEDLEPSPQQLG